MTRRHGKPSATRRRIDGVHVRFHYINQHNLEILSFHSSTIKYTPFFYLSQRLYASTISPATAQAAAVLGEAR